MNINLTFDSSTNGAPSAFFAAINAVVQYFDSVFTNPVSVNINVGYGEIDGQSLQPNSLGESEANFNQYSYSDIRAALIANGGPGSNTLPAADPTNGGNYFVASAEAKAIGLSGPSSATDGFIGFGSQGVDWTYNTINGGPVAPGTDDFFAVAAHEISEVMGRELFVGDQGGQGRGPNSYTPLDLFDWNFGRRDFSPGGVLSVDGDRTSLGFFNSDPNGDFGDWASITPHDAFLAFISPGVSNEVSRSDLIEMSALGYDANIPATVPGNIGFAANFAGNGFADVIWQDTTFGTATIWTNSAGTIPSGSASFSVPTSWRVVGIGDFNGDGKSDVMWQATDGAPGIWLMNGTTPIAEAAFLNPGAAWHVAATGDFDASGRSGLVWQNGTTLGVWLMNGTTPTAEVGFAGPGPNWNVVGTADLTNNGRDEILLQNAATGNLTIDFMNGTSVTSSATITVGDPSWHVVATGRENGQAAIIWQNTNGQAGIWLMNGATPVAEAGLPNPGGDWQIISTGDFNNDGNSDLLFRSVSAGQSAIWLMNGTQVKSEGQPQINTGNSATASTVAAASSLSAASVLSPGDVLYPAGADISATQSAGPGSLAQTQLAAPTGAGLGNFLIRT